MMNPAGKVGRKFASLACVVALVSCGPPESAKVPAAPSSACTGTKLAACEENLARATLAGELTPLDVDVYISARAAREGDGWADLYSQIPVRDAPPVLVVDSSGSANLTLNNVRVVRPQKLPPLEKIQPEILLQAIGKVRGVRHLIWVAEGGQSAVEIFPNDVLAPQMLGVPSFVNVRFSASKVEENIKLAASVNRAFEAAGAFNYKQVAAEADVLQTLLTGRDPFEEPVLRARYARALFASAGLTWEEPVNLFGADIPVQTPTKQAPPAPASTDSAYGDLLRVRLAEDVSKEWTLRSTHILSAISPDRHAHAHAIFGAATACAAFTPPPEMDRLTDVGFAGLLPTALAGAREQAIISASQPGLVLSNWYERYERLVERVEKSQLVWLHISSLLRQRGELPGVSSAGSPTYKKVTQLGLKHIQGLRDLSEEQPTRYQSSAELPLAYSPGLLGDPSLTSALIDLTQASTKNKLAVASQPGPIAGTLLIGAFAGMTYPPAIQSAHYLALQSAFAAKIKGDLLQQTGWGAAALFAIDAVVRVVADLGPNLAFSSDQIVRALSDPKLPLANVAAVVSAVAKYAALAKDKPLAAIVTAAQSTPERAAARETLRKAIVGMGNNGEAPASLADEITSLADGLIAVLTVRLHEKSPSSATCSDKSKSASDIEVEHALGKLNSIRQKIVSSPTFKSGDNLWTRRARLLVVALSDGMDFLAPIKAGKKRDLTLSAAQVETALTQALKEWEDPGARDALVGVYSLVRFFAAGDPAKRFDTGGPYLSKALGGIGRFLRTGGPSGAPSMLDALAEMSGRPGGPDDLARTLIGYADTFYQKNLPDQADLFLLSGLLLSSVRKTPPPNEALTLAAKHKSRIEWALNLFAEVNSAEKLGKIDISKFAESSDKAARDLCSAGRTGDVVDVLRAVSLFGEGKRKEARALLDTTLRRAETEGLVVPKLNYNYSEKYDRKVFSLSFALTQGTAFISGGNTFHVGLGISTLSEKSNRLTTSAASAEDTASETAHFYVQVAGLSAAYHYLDGDVEAGSKAARKAVLALANGVRLGARSITRDRRDWAKDARAVLALNAQLAADTKSPFLAGDLWTVVKESLPTDFRDDEVSQVLASAPFGLAGVKDVEAPLTRARKALQLVAAPLSCTQAKVETSAYEQASCDTYPTALGLRIADVLGKMPHYKKTPDGKGAECEALASLDAFLTSAERGAYDPDAFTKAVEQLRGAGKPDEAAALLARQRKPEHCNPTLLAAARTLGRSPALPSMVKADMFTVAINCAGVSNGAGLEKDLSDLDLETRFLADPIRNLKVLFFAAELALKTDKGDLLYSLVQDPHFLDRFLNLHGNAVAAALLFHHGGHVLTGKPFDLAQTEGAYSLICTSFPSPERKAECDDLKAIRASDRASSAAKKLAEGALLRLISPQKKP
ncbi:MAG: hypothetical protein IPK82_27280 [Polyangiaceae bacterium]|nr:hypothetical protein [Polyangiaceae bacterium]